MEFFSCYLTLCTVYTYDLNERSKFINKDIGKFFAYFPKYGERIIDTRTRCKIADHKLSSGIGTLFTF